MDDRPRRMRTRAEAGGRLASGMDAVKPARVVRVPTGDAGAMVLRPLAESDRAAFVSLVEESLDHLSPWLPVLADGTGPEAFFEQELERGLEAARRGHAARFVAEIRGQIVGSFALTNITRGLSFQADASWWVGKAYLRRGHARQGLGKLLRVAFEDAPEGLGLTRVIATIAPENEASLRLARSFGFRRLEREDHHLRIGPVWKRHLCFAADSFDHERVELKPTGDDS